ncbi:predicted protein [Naegleria gruberi]|uniref:Predicted protein n=1 Tax=Naegleria gruberi TaxID=5762 RepID=D2VSR0_NAEGR|nr:uncharacterized protein NAEGRDRAFT_81103 [Naegleria gruberi]EFC40163.1 predicted protein [Naegleria gruberi]|eukprot:XP_002672907.1 predicted protein [Naegleria gruberi strain NEG-M]
MQQQPKVNIIEQGNIWTIENLYSPEECQQLIKICESNGFVEAPFNANMAKDTRNNDRVILDLPQHAQLFWERVSPYLPQHASQLGNQVLESNAKSGFQLLNPGFSNRLRFYRYKKGQYFAPHTDGCYFDNRDKYVDQSFLTILLYLNDVNNAGGETNFIQNGIKHSVQPKSGSVLIFVHWNCHEGAEVTSSNALKYVMRTDAVFRRIK